MGGKIIDKWALSASIHYRWGNNLGIFQFPSIKFHKTRSTFNLIMTMDQGNQDNQGKFYILESEKVT